MWNGRRKPLLQHSQKRPLAQIHFRLGERGGETANPSQRLGGAIWITSRGFLLPPTLGTPPHTLSVPVRLTHWVAWRTLYCLGQQWLHRTEGLSYCPGVAGPYRPNSWLYRTASARFSGGTAWQGSFSCSSLSSLALTLLVFPAARPKKIPSFSKKVAEKKYFCVDKLIR